ncbi:CaiB/BaiF CoA transferase family protein [Acerihabitans sp.]|uniref:CaiB/BaiF CoA transferase family protein n=1 Tax=Acerihabitans sp. TaxID=2811394 RepID=UPI002EDB48BF
MAARQVDAQAPGIHGIAGVGTLAALNHRNQTGEGQKVDIALVDSVVASLEIITQIYLTEGRIPERIGNRYESCYPYDTFEAKNGDVVIAAANDKLWRLVARVMAQPELAERDEFKTNPLRVQNHARLKAIMEAWTRRLDVDDIVNQMLAAGVPAAPINNIDQLIADPHIADAREMFVDIVHPIAGKLKLTGSHIKLSKTKTGLRTPSPLLGQHNAQVYGEILGLSGADIEQLTREGVL